MSRFAEGLHAVAAAIGILSACGGSDEAAAPPESRPLASPHSVLGGSQVSGSDEALRIVASGVVAPLYYCDLVHATLVRVFELRASARGARSPASAGDAWVEVLDARPLGAELSVAGRIGVVIEAADNAEGLLLRGEAGSVRAVLRLERLNLGAAQVDGAVTLDVSRSATGEGQSRRSRAETLSLRDARGTRHWSYLDVDVDAQRLVQRLTVVSDVTVDAAAPVWIDATSSTPGRLDAAAAGAALSSGRYVATGVTGFLNARLTLLVAADGAWTIEVDNDKDDRTDFVAHASPAEARALTSGRPHGQAK